MQGVSESGSEVVTVRSGHRQLSISLSQFSSKLTSAQVGQGREAYMLSAVEIRTLAVK